MNDGVDTPADTGTKAAAALGCRPRRVWAVSEPKAGTLTQCVGVGLHFDPEPAQKLVMRARGLSKLFARPIFSRSEAPPDILISCGMRPERHVMEMHRAFKQAPLRVHLQRPRGEGYDMCFVSRHDWTPEFDAKPGYHAVVGVPHRVTEGMLASLREPARQRFAPAGEKLVAIFVGGANGAYSYDDDTLADIAGNIRQLVEQGWKVLLSTSRRSSEKTLHTLLELRSDKVEVWDRTGDNPYFSYLAAADAFLIAKDSITMPCEALVSGKPVYALELGHIEGVRLVKFERFHHDLQVELGLTRPFRGELASYDYTPLDETRRIAGLIDRTLKAAGK